MFSRINNNYLCDIGTSIDFFKEKHTIPAKKLLNWVFFISHLNFSPPEYGTTT